MTEFGVTIAWMLCGLVSFTMLKSHERTVEMLARSLVAGFLGMALILTFRDEDG